MPDAAQNECRLPSADLVSRRTIYVSLMLLALLCYRGVLDNWLFNDDFSWLKAARYDMRPGNLFTFQVVEFFRPLVNLSFWAMEKVDPGNVPMHYAVSIVLHILCTFLVFRLAEKLLGNLWLAAMSGALFAVTSVHSAAVFWISARTTLLSSFFLLASIDVALPARGSPATAAASPERRPGTMRGIASVLLYVLALASKEDAIAGLFLIAILYTLGRRGKDGRGPVSTPLLVAFALVSVTYLLVRQSIMGGYVRENWGPGWHGVRNVAGGFLDQLYPWPFFSLFYRAGTSIPEPAGAVSPEIVALPIIALLAFAGYAARKPREMAIAILWGLLAIVPASFFRYRFFSTVSISQNRYYYLSSAGTVMIVALLLSLVWKERSRARQWLMVALFAVMCAGYVVRDARLERKWGDFTKMYREIVSSVVEECSKFPGETTLAVENSPLAFPYMADALALERPAWRTVRVASRDEAVRYAPCLYVSFRGEMPRILRVEEIER